MLSPQDIKLPAPKSCNTVFLGREVRSQCFTMLRLQEYMFRDYIEMNPDTNQRILPGFLAMLLKYLYNSTESL